MAKNKDSREAWVEAQAEALYQDLKAREEAADAAENTAHIGGTHYGVHGGVNNAPINFNFN